MERDYKDKISQTVKKIGENYDDLFELSISSIKDKYNDLDSNQKKDFIKYELEGILEEEDSDKRLDLYLSTIRDSYQSFDHNQKNHFMSKLENVLDTLENRDLEYEEIPYDPVKAKKARKNSGISQGELSKKIGVTQPSFSRWESGEFKKRLDKFVIYFKFLRDNGYMIT